jgi:hypothetical protein
MQRKKEVSNMKNRKNLWFLPHLPVFNPKKPGKLRLVYDAAAKNLNIPKNILDGTNTPTKREILRVTMSVVDPIGFLSPISISLQKIWKNGIGWDDELKTNLCEDWKSWPLPELF